MTVLQRPDGLHNAFKNTEYETRFRRLEAAAGNIVSGGGGGTSDSGAYGSVYNTTSQVSAGAWKSLLMPTTLVQTADVPVVIQPDNKSFKINYSGRYLIVGKALATVSPTVDIRCILQITTNSALDLGVGVSPATGVTWDESNVAGNLAASPTLSTQITRTFSAGDVIRLNCYCGTAGIGFYLSELYIVRIGGTKGDKGDTGATGPAALSAIPLDPWHLVGGTGEPAFAGGWANVAGPASPLRFRKDPLGRVWVIGQIVGPATGTAFTLPAGYLPKRNEIFDNLQTNGAAGTYVQASTAGVVTVTVGAASYVAYVDFSFDTELVTAMPAGPAGPTGPAGPPGGTTQAFRSEYGAAVAGTGPYTLPIADANVAGNNNSAGNFTRNADGSITIRDAGWYDVNASVYYQGSGLGHVMLTGDAAAATIYTEEYGIGPVIFSLGTTINVVAGQKLWIYHYNAASASSNVRNFSISRAASGAKGDKGDTGAKGDPGYSDYAYIQTAMSTVNAAAGSSFLPIAAGAPSSDPTVFDWIAEGTILVKKSGYYSISATAYSDTAMLDTDRLQYEIWKWDATNAAAAGVTANVAVTSESSTGPIPIASMSGVFYLEANSRVGVGAYCSKAHTSHTSRFEMARIGAGPAGPQGPTGPQGPVASSAILLDTWHTVGAPGEPAYAAGFSTAGDLAFRKDPFGRVMFKGRAYSPTGGAGTVFQLPAGYGCPLPLKRFVITAEASTGGQLGFARCYVSGGTVVIDSQPAGSYYYDLSVVEFDTESVTTAGVGPQGVMGPQGPQGLKGDPGVYTDPLIQRRQNIGAAIQTASGNAVAFTYNVANAPYLDLTAGTWRVEAAALIYSNVPDYVCIGLWDETLGAGIANSGGASSVTGPLSGAQGYDVARTAFTLTLTSPRRIRIWVVPNGGSTMSVAPAANTPSAYMMGYLIGPGAQGPAGPSTPIPVVSATPANPVEGQEIYLQTPLMLTLGLMWRFRYSSTAPDPYKWLFVGGNDFHVRNSAGFTPPANVWTSDPDTSMWFTVPVLGEYDLLASANTYSPDSVARGHNVGLGAAPGAAYGIDTGPSSGFGTYGEAFGRQAAAAGEVWRPYYFSGSGVFRWRTMSAKPYRIA
jgi:hypothetical protein